MALTESPPEMDTAVTVPEATDETLRTTQPTAIERLVGSGDHRVVGRVFIVGSLLFLVANLVVSGLVDLDTATDSGVFQAEAARRLLDNHQLGLLILGILPLLLGLAICVVPRQLGSPSIAFPRAAAAAAWTWLGCSIVFVVAVAANGSYGGENLKTAHLGNVAIAGAMVGLMLAMVCLAVTVLTLRPAGMSLGDVPFFAFSILVTSTIGVLTFPAALAHVVIGQISHANADTLQNKIFADGVAWLLVQPALYLVLVPVLGIVADVAATAVGGRQRFRGAVQGAIAAFGLFSYGAWAQSLEARSTIVWVAVTLAIGLPLLALFGGVADTLRQGRPSLMSPLAASVLAVLVALVGVAMGLVQTINTFGHGYLANFDLARLALGQERVIFGAAIVGAVGGLFYWGQTVTGAAVSDLPGKGIAPLLALGVVLWGVPWFIEGLATPDDTSVWAGLAAAGAAVVALGVLGAVAELARSSRTAGRGDELLADVWGGGGTLEWAEPTTEPVVVESPYPVLDGKAER